MSLALIGDVIMGNLPIESLYEELATLASVREARLRRRTVWHLLSVREVDSCDRFRFYAAASSGGGTTGWTFFMPLPERALRSKRPKISEAVRLRE